MKNSEETVERVLAKLRSAEAPDGMQSRIAAALANHATTRPGPVGKRFAAITPLRCAVAAAAVLAIVWTAPAVRRLTHASMQSAQSSQPKPASPATPSLIAATPDTPTVSTQSPSRPQAQAKARPITWTNAPNTKPVLDMDAIALDEMRAPSQPPPPIPLTEEEKLLLRITRNRNPVQLASLNPAMRAERDAQEEADYLSFFESPIEPLKTGDSE